MRRKFIQLSKTRITMSVRRMSRLTQHKNKRKTKMGVGMRR
jgi:hypothetical protein